MKFLFYVLALIAVIGAWTSCTEAAPRRIRIIIIRIRRPRSVPDVDGSQLKDPKVPLPYALDSNEGEFGVADQLEYVQGVELPNYIEGGRAYAVYENEDVDEDEQKLGEGTAADQLT